MTSIETSGSPVEEGIQGRPGDTVANVRSIVQERRIGDDGSARVPTADKKAGARRTRTGSSRGLSYFPVKK
jgi:hypothetical protein